STCLDTISQPTIDAGQMHRRWSIAWEFPGRIFRSGRVALVFLTRSLAPRPGATAAAAAARARRHRKTVAAAYPRVHRWTSAPPVHPAPVRPAPPRATRRGRPAPRPAARHVVRTARA